jgi:hypothetical protein
MSGVKAQIGIRMKDAGFFVDYQDRILLGPDSELEEAMYKKLLPLARNWR